MSTIRENARSTANGAASERYDVVVVGATPGGIACALRCAREGLRVFLAESTEHVGGMWSSGVQILDTRYAGHRCPVLSEFLARLESHYRQASGEGSPDHVMCQFGEASQHGKRPRFEPHVAEQIFREMLTDGGGIRLELGCDLERVEMDGAQVRQVSFRGRGFNSNLLVWAKIFVDASYTGDLAALAGARCRVGREGAAEFYEPHAGVHFTTIEPIGPSGHGLAEELGLHYFNRTSRSVFPESTGASDRAVQAYSVRLVLTDRPENLRAIPRPDGYRRERYLGAIDRSPGAHTLGHLLSSHLLVGSIEHLHFQVTMPNGKMDWFGGNLVGGSHDYPLASPARRRAIYQEHVDHALGLLHFFQHDDAVPQNIREHTRQWGLARDEYVDNGNIPPRMYVREARRLDGLYVFSEHDARRHPLHERSPIHPDSIAFAEWPMDSHDCNPVRQPGSFNDGEFILAAQTVPSQIPYRTMLSANVDNLLVPVCLSATHVGWGTLRLEPVFIHVGEAAGVAAAVSLQTGERLRNIRPATLQWELLRRRIAVAYFADVDLGRIDSAAMSAQYLASRGFFASYKANLEQRISVATNAVWLEGLSRFIAGRTDPDEFAKDVLAASQHPDKPIFAPADEAAAALLQRQHMDENTTPITIGDACQLLCRAMQRAEAANVAV